MDATRTTGADPDPPSYWRGGTAEQIARAFLMFQLSLAGLGDGLPHLSKGDVRKR